MQQEKRSGFSPRRERNGSESRREANSVVKLARPSAGSALRYKLGSSGQSVKAPLPSGAHGGMEEQGGPGHVGKEEKTRRKYLHDLHDESIIVMVNRCLIFSEMLWDRHITSSLTPMLLSNLI